MRSIILLCLLLVCVPCAWGEDAPAPSAKLLAEADKTFRLRDYAGATERFKLAAAAAEKEGATERLVEALAMAARGHLIRKQPALGQPLLDRAAKLATDKAPLGWSRFLGVRGRFEWKVRKDKPLATKTFEAMYRYCVKHELWSRAVDATHMVAITGTLDQQVTWAAKGIAAAEKGKRTEWLGPLWNNLGNTHQERGEHDKALAAWLKARHYHWLGTQELPKLVADWAVGMGYRHLGKWKEAKAWLRPTLAWAERRYAEEKTAERGEWIGLACLELGLIAVAEKRLPAARADLERAYPLLKAVKMADWHPKLWKELLDGLKAADADAAATGVHRHIFASALDVYRMQHKKLPKSLATLTEMDGRNPHPILKAVPLDPWGREYAYKTLDRSTYEIRSCGRDGEPGTDDDVVWSNR